MFFPKSPRQVFIVVLAAATLLTSCSLGATPAPTVDVNALNTAAVSTAMAQLSLQFTQTALAAPTFTPTSTNTAASLPDLSSPTVSGTLPTLSFNTTPIVGTPLPGFTPIGGATTLPGFTPLATSGASGPPTASLGDSCNNNVFEGDITIPDGEVIKPGTNFQKIWKIRNTGTCTWDDGYTLVYIAGSNPNLDPYNFEFKNKSDFVTSGGAINIALNLTTPCTPGKYEGHWRMRNDTGYYFGTILSVYVEVKEKC